MSVMNVLFLHYRIKQMFHSPFPRQQMVLKENNSLLLCLELHHFSLSWCLLHSSVEFFLPMDLFIWMVTRNWFESWTGIASSGNHISIRFFIIVVLCKTKFVLMWKCLTINTYNWLMYTNDCVIGVGLNYCEFLKIHI